MSHGVVHFEIDAEDDGSLVAFYGGLFGWALQRSAGGGYTAIDTRGGGGINGGIGQSRAGRPWSAFCVEADDPQATLDKATALGAQTLMPVTELDGGLRLAMFSDIDGLPVGLVKGLPAAGPSAGTGEAVDWFEVMGSDAERTQNFYTDLFGWKIDRSFPGYGVADTGAGRGLMGGVGGGADVQWVVVYAGVSDVDEKLRRAVEMGASPAPAPRLVELKRAARTALYGSADDVTMDVFRDPAGNTFGVYHKAGK